MIPSYRHILRTPLLGRFLIPWDMCVPAFWVLGGFLTGLNLVFLCFALGLSMIGLFWVRKTGEGTIRAMVLYHLRNRVYFVA